MGTTKTTYKIRSENGQWCCYYAGTIKNFDGTETVYPENNVIIAANKHTAVFLAEGMVKDSARNQNGYDKLFVVAFPSGRVVATVEGS